MTNYVGGLARRLAGGFASGLRAADESLDEPGLAGKEPEPFAPGTVSAGALAAKSLSSLIYGRRAAATARRDTADKAIASRLRDAQIKALEAKASPESTKEYDIPKVGKVRLTDSQAASHAAAIGGPAGPKRTAVSKEIADRLATAGFPLQTLKDGTADDSELARVTPLYSLAQSKTERDKAATATKHYTAAQAALGNLDKEAEREGDLNATHTQEVIDSHLKTLQNPSASRKDKQAAAAQLGLQVSRDPSNPTQELSDPAGNPIYDLGSSQARQALQQLVDRAKSRGVDRHSKANAARRAALELVSTQESAAAMPTPASAPDPVQAGIDSLSKLYAPREPAGGPAGDEETPAEDAQPGDTGEDSVDSAPADLGLNATAASPLSRWTPEMAALRESVNAAFAKNGSATSLLNELSPIQRKAAQLGITGERWKALIKQALEANQSR